MFQPARSCRSTEEIPSEEEDCIAIQQMLDEGRQGSRRSGRSLTAKNYEEKASSDDEELEIAVSPRKRRPKVLDSSEDEDSERLNWVPPSKDQDSIGFRGFTFDEASKRARGPMAVPVAEPSYKVVEPSQLYSDEEESSEDEELKGRVDHREPKNKPEIRDYSQMDVASAEQKRHTGIKLDQIARSFESRAGGMSRGGRGDYRGGFNRGRGGEAGRGRGGFR